MKLASYDTACVLSVDYRYLECKDRIWEMMVKKGVFPAFFVNGQGNHLPRMEYDLIHSDSNPEWQDGRPSYNQFLSIKQIIKEVKEGGENHLLMIEDDLLLGEDFDQVLDKAKIPEDWDMIYYGANHSNAKTHEVNEHVLRCYGSTTTHLVGIRRTIFDAILALPSDRTMDWNIANRLHDKFNCYAIYPSIATQSPGYSQLWRQEVDYSKLWASKGIPI